MKHTWAVRRAREAVSPVIATILMVAITVVLAAVLYVMVSGLIAGPSTGGPEVAFLPAKPTGVANEYKLEIGSVSTAAFITNYQIVLLNVTSNSAAVLQTDLVVGNVGTEGGVTLTFSDLNGDGKVGGGDFFILQGVKGNNSYQITLYWKPTGSRIIAGSVPA